MMVAVGSILLLVFVANPCLGINQLISPFINELIAAKAALVREVNHYEKLQQDMVVKSNDLGLRTEIENTLMQIAFLTKMEWVLTLAQEKFMATVKMERKLLRDMESEVNSLNMQMEIAQNNDLLQRDLLTCGSLKYQNNDTSKAGITFTLADLNSPNITSHKNDADNLDNLRKQLEVHHLKEKLRILEIKRKGMESGIDTGPKKKKKGGDIITHNHIINDVKITNKPVKITRIKNCVGKCAPRRKKRVKQVKEEGRKQLAIRRQSIHATNAEYPSEEKETEKSVKKESKAKKTPKKNFKGKKKPKEKKFAYPRMIKLAKKNGKKETEEKVKEETQKNEIVEQEENVKEEQEKVSIVDQEENINEEEKGESVVQEDNVTVGTQNTEIAEQEDNIKEEGENEEVAAPQKNLTEDKNVEQEDNVKEGENEAPQQNDAEEDKNVEQEDNVKEGENEDGEAPQQNDAEEDKNVEQEDNVKEAEDEEPQQNVTEEDKNIDQEDNIKEGENEDGEAPQQNDAEEDKNVEQEENVKEGENEDGEAPQQNDAEEDKNVEQEENVKEGENEDGEAPLQNVTEDDKNVEQEDNVKEEVDNEQPVEQDGIQENDGNEKEQQQEDGVENT